MDSFVRWAGSKRKTLHELRPYWVGNPAHYIEPFAGSASLFFDIQPQNAILGDLNEELIRTMRAVQHDVYRVLECLRRLPKGKTAYYAIRGTNIAALTEFEAAARFLYLNRYCFNGLYRTNTKGQFNVPYGPPKKETPIDEHGLEEAARVLQTARLLSGDFQATLSFARPGDFVYLDPPYVTFRRRIFSEYLPGSFSSTDLDRLEAALRDLDSKRIFFLITYADTPEARRLLWPWNSRRVRVRRNIAGFSGDRRECYELLATNIGG